MPREAGGSNRGEHGLRQRASVAPCDRGEPRGEWLGPRSQARYARTCADVCGTSGRQRHIVELARQRWYHTRVSRRIAIASAARTALTAWPDPPHRAAPAPRYRQGFWREGKWCLNARRMCTPEPAMTNCRPGRECQLQPMDCLAAHGFGEDASVSGPRTGAVAPRRDGAPSHSYAPTNTGSRFRAPQVNPSKRVCSDARPVAPRAQLRRPEEEARFTG